MTEPLVTCPDCGNTNRTPVVGVRPDPIFGGWVCPLCGETIMPDGEFKGLMGEAFKRLVAGKELTP